MDERNYKEKKFKRTVTNGLMEQRNQTKRTGRPHNQSTNRRGWQGLWTLPLLLRFSFSSSFSCSSFTSFSTSHASSSSSSVWGVWSHSQKCLKLPSSSGAEFSTSVPLGLSLPRLLRRWGGSFGGGGRGGTLEAAFAGLDVSGTGQRLMVPPPPPSSSLCDWLSSCFCCCCWVEQIDLGWMEIQRGRNSQLSGQ